MKLIPLVTSVLGLTYLNQVSSQPVRSPHHHHKEVEEINVEDAIDYIIAEIESNTAFDAGDVAQAFQSALDQITHTEELVAGATLTSLVVPSTSLPYYPNSLQTPSTSAALIIETLFYSSSASALDSLGSLASTETSKVLVYETVHASASSAVTTTNIRSLSSSEVVTSIIVEASTSVGESSTDTVTPGLSSSSSSSTALTSTATISSSSTTYTGRGTYYEPSADACGTSSTASDYVVAIAESLYTSLGVNSEEVSTACGEYIIASYEGKSVRVKVVDECASCTDVDLDFSPAAFEQLAALDIGEIQITWAWSS